MFLIQIFVKKFKPDRTFDLTEFTFGTTNGDIREDAFNKLMTLPGISKREGRLDPALQSQAYVSERVLKKSQSIPARIQEAGIRSMLHSNMTVGGRSKSRKAKKRKSRKNKKSRSRTRKNRSFKKNNKNKNTKKRR